MAETAQAQAQAPAQPTEVGKWNTTRPMGDCCWLGFSLDCDELVGRYGLGERAWGGNSRALEGWWYGGG